MEANEPCRRRGLVPHVWHQAATAAGLAAGVRVGPRPERGIFPARMPALPLALACELCGAGSLCAPPQHGRTLPPRRVRCCRRAVALLRHASDPDAWRREEADQCDRPHTVTAGRRARGRCWCGVSCVWKDLWRGVCAARLGCGPRLQGTVPSGSETGRRREGGARARTPSALVERACARASSTLGGRRCK